MPAELSFFQKIEIFLTRSRTNNSRKKVHCQDFARQQFNLFFGINYLLMKKKLQMTYTKARSQCSSHACPVPCFSSLEITMYSQATFFNDF